MFGIESQLSGIIVTCIKHDCEPIVVRDAKQRKADKGGGPTVKDGWAHLSEGNLNPSLAVA